MRIIPDDIQPMFFDNDGSVLGKEYGYAYRLHDTIELTDDEWDAIAVAWYDIGDRSLSVLLRELISLARERK